MATTIRNSDVVPEGTAPRPTTKRPKSREHDRSNEELIELDQAEESGYDEVEDADMVAAMDDRIAGALGEGMYEPVPEERPREPDTIVAEDTTEVPEYSLADFVDTESEAAMAESQSGEGTDSGRPKNPLIDPTIGARPAGIPEETLATLFKKTHGGSFDPNSKTDRAKMQIIRDMIQEDKSLLALSPAKFALKVYARK